MVALGAYHGINPGMGWLFAVALGMQQGRASGVWRALPPIALGHAAAVGVVVAIAAIAQVVIPREALKVGIAATLVTLGGYRLWRHRHPRFGGMQVGFRDLVIWSFLMASAHGAGVMVLPFVMPIEAAVSAEGPHAHHAITASAPWADALAVGIHSLTLSPRHHADRVDRLPQGWSRDSADRLVQPRLAVGRRARCHRCTRPSELIPASGLPPPASCLLPPASASCLLPPAACLTLTS